MVDFLNNTVGSSLEDQKPIEKWEVWFLTPNGVVQTVEEAIKVTKELLGEDANVNMYIIPIPMARRQNYCEGFKRG